MTKKEKEVILDVAWESFKTRVTKLNEEFDSRNKRLDKIGKRLANVHRILDKI